MKNKIFVFLTEEEQLNFEDLHKKLDFDFNLVNLFFQLLIKKDEGIVQGV